MTTMMSEVQVKIEPRDDHEEQLEPDDLRTLGPGCFDLVDIKPETTEDFDIKAEPSDSGNEEFVHESYPQVKIESYSDGEVMGKQNIVRDRPVSRKTPRKRKESSDEEYTLPTYKKKGKKKKGDVGNVKPSVRGKSKAKADMIYTEEITSQIEIVTITEEERRLEHQELLQSRRHMRYLCEWCAIGFVVEDAYQLHMKLHSEENGAHECGICHARLRSADVLYRHRLRHYRRYRCELCALLLRDKDTAAAHVMSEHHGTAFRCHHCDKGFKRPQYLKRHVAQMHTRATEYKCDVCGRVFYERAWFRCHVRTHNEEVQMSAGRRLPCTYCAREFRTRAHLTRHLLTHEVEPVDCLHCGATCANPALLRAHTVKQHPEMVGDVDTVCTHCGRACATPGMLHRHLRRMHTDRTKRFECEHCSRRYLTKGEVRSHIMWSHMRRLGGHACACGRVFRSPARLAHHTRTSHLQVPQPRDKHCPVCGKSFANQQVLTRHIRGHSGTTYPCTECGQTFKTQSYVKVHYKIKHLNMTRAQVKAESKRKLLMVENLDEYMNASVPRHPGPPPADPLHVDDPPCVADVKREDDIAVPTFETFMDIPR